MAYCCYVVATPIGNLADLSPRAVSVLSQVGVILAEDTRHSKKLLQHFGIATRMMALHDHNETKVLDAVLAQLQLHDVALISDAGTPLISDPGFKLVRFLRSHDIDVVPLPGATAAVAALSVSGLPTDRFSFEGFLPSAQQARAKVLEDLVNNPRTMVFYESPKRVLHTVAAMAEVFGPTREACVARELTKAYEQVVTDTLAGLQARLEAGEIPAKGEFVLMVTGGATLADQAEVQRILRILLPNLGVKKSAALASEITGVAKNKAYTLALEIKETMQ